MASKKDRDLPVTNKDWLLLIRDLPGGCWWAVLVAVIGLVIKLFFF